MLSSDKTSRSATDDFDPFGHQRSNNTLVLCSGGLSAAVLLAEQALVATARTQKTRVQAISFAYGSLNTHRKEQAADAFCDALGIQHERCALGFVEEILESPLIDAWRHMPEGPHTRARMRQTSLPFLDGILLASAAAYAQQYNFGFMATGVSWPHHGRDDQQHKGVMDGMQAAIAAGTYNLVQLIAPFSSLRKSDVVLRGLNYKVDFSKTWSCYRGDDLSCGRCGACCERLWAFNAAGATDPLEYQDREYYRTAIDAP